MGTYNTLHAGITCPHCNTTVDTEIDTYFGDTLQMQSLLIGNAYPWRPGQDVDHGGRPEGGNIDGEGYTVCPNCQRDFFVKVVVRGDKIESVRPDPDKPGYIRSAEDLEVIIASAARPNSAEKWDPAAHAQAMRKSTLPVSAFFLIDSLESIPICIQWLTLLKPYGMPDMQGSEYFDEVREIYRSGRKVMNVDYKINLIWQRQELLTLLRCHYFDKGQYEMELQLPGVIANDVAVHFKDGHEGFWCGFMSHAFYD